MATLLRDIRQALRMILRRPATSAVIVLILAIGVGANMAMFSGFDAWVLRPLPFADPQRLVALHESQPKLGRTRHGVAPANLRDWGQQQRVFTDIAAFVRHIFNFQDEEWAERIDGVAVSANLFPLLGITPCLGRGFVAEEDLPEAARVAIIGHGLWERRFAGDPDIVGSSLRLDGELYEIIGVMEAGFKFPEWAQVWIPLALDPADQDRERRWLSVVARLAPGASRDDAQAAMATIAGRLEALHPETNSGWNAQVIPLREYFVPPVIDAALSVCVGLALLVLLIICANVANLMLAQATARQRETAIRAALGASRVQLVRQTLTESTLLALPAAVLGAGLGKMNIDWSMSWVPMEPPYLFAFRTDARVLGFTLIVALAAGLLCGLAPVMRGTGLDIFAVLRSGDSRVGPGPRGSRLRSSLVVAEFAVTVLLVVGALLLVKSFYHQQQVEPGCRTDDLLTARLTLTGSALADPGDRQTFVNDLLGRLNGRSEVEAAGVANHLPVSRSGYREVRLEVEGAPTQPGDAPETTLYAVTPRYLETVEIPLLEGRAITATEFEEGAPLTLVSRSLARRLWPNEDPLLKRIRPLRDGQGEWLTVVGVVGDIDPGHTMVDFGMRPESQIYVPWAREPAVLASLALRSDAGKEAVAAAVRAEVRRLDPGVPVSDVLTMDEAIAEVRWVTRYFSEVFSLYAVLALAVAALGAYGVVTDSVSRRIREMGIRLALGARPGDLVRLVVRQGFTLGGVGVVIGLVGALPLTRLVSAMLYEVSPNDPLVFVGVAALMAAVACIAAYLPARRAARVDPMTVLRFE